MFKKILCVILYIVILISVLLGQQTLSFRNVDWGMSKEQVKFFSQDATAICRQTNVQYPADIEASVYKYLTEIM